MLGFFTIVSLVASYRIELVSSSAVVLAAWATAAALLLLLAAGK